MSDQLLTRINLEGCPVGTVLDPNEPDQSVEEQYFHGWTNGLTAPPNWKMASAYRIVEDGTATVLEHIDKTDRSLVTGQPLWGDYTVEGSIRQLNAFSQPSSDDPHSLIARSGLVLRYQDLRRYYFFCMEGFDRFALYRRVDAAWTLLAEMSNGIDRSRYYRLKAVCQGERISGYIDGDQAFVAYDDAFATGKLGVRTNTRSRMYDIAATAPEKAQAAYISRLDAYEKNVAQAAEKYPQPVLWKRLDISAYWPCSVRYGDFRGGGDKEIILQQTTATGPRIICLDLAGQVQWDRTYQAAANLQHIQMHDLDGDGVEDFIGIADGQLRLINGASGHVTAETPLPTTGPYRGHRNASVGDYLHSLKVLWPCKLRHTAKAQDLILRDGDGAGTGYSIWAFDDQLKLRWRRDADNAWYGMYMWFYDVDGDGRDEILPGYDLYDGDGKHLWTMEGAEYIEDSGGAGHIDHAAFGELDGDPSNGPEIGIAGSDPGFFLVDARTGAVRRQHSFGHVQGIYAGNFRPDLPGLEMWMGDRWGTYGILNLVSGQGDPLNRFEPDNISQGGAAVNWSGDGEELLFVQTSPQAFGLYDACARKVIRPVCEGLPFDWGHGLIEDVVGDARDEITYVRDGALYIVTQDRPYPSGGRIYTPSRSLDISHPGWSINL
ncbi:MAG: hypothetical protein GKR89_20645 [Candidatus Latescibacteria bacterium]|nr:hypothetical protein [Candidatus Latescibacterota bacterium]